jgi:hypothetical protein
MLTVLGGLAEFERHLILARTSEGTFATLISDWRARTTTALAIV